MPDSQARVEQPWPLACPGGRSAKLLALAAWENTAARGLAGVLPKHVLRPPGGASCLIGVCCKPDAAKLSVCRQPSLPTYYTAICTWGGSQVQGAVTAGARLHLLDNERRNERHKPG